MAVTQLVGLLGVVLVVSAFVIYSLSDEKISTGSWWLWAAGDAFDFFTYDSMTSGGAVDYIPAAFMVGSVATFAIALFRRRFSWPDIFDRFLVVLDLGITSGWLWKGLVSATVANVLLQLSTVMSFVPICRGILDGRENEKPLPWVLWTVGNACFVLVVWLSPHDRAGLVYPLVAFGTHASALWCICVAKKRGVSI